MNLQEKVRTGQYAIDQETGRIQFHDIRFYVHEPTGEFYPSVTTVLGMAYPKDPMFFQWLKENGENADAIRDTAGEFGSMVHKMTEDYDAGLPVSILDEFGKPQYSSREWKFFEKYVEFINRFNPDIHNIEVNMVSPTYKVGGTLDRKISLEVQEGKGKDKQTVKKKYILDIKTSNLMHDSYWIQLAQYRRMWLELFPEDQIDGICVLWLNAKTRTEGKDGAIQGKGWQLLFPEKEVEHYERLWDHTKALFDEQFSNMKPNNVVYQLTHQKKIDA